MDSEWFTRQTLSGAYPSATLHWLLVNIFSSTIRVQHVVRNIYPRFLIKSTDSHLRLFEYYSNRLKVKINACGASGTKQLWWNVPREIYASDCLIKWRGWWPNNVRSNTFSVAVKNSRICCSIIETTTTLTFVRIYWTDAYVSRSGVSYDLMGGELLKLKPQGLYHLELTTLQVLKRIFLSSPTVKWLRSLTISGKHSRECQLFQSISRPSISPGKLRDR